MPLHIRCTCGCSHRVPESAVGKTFRCKKCNAVNKVSRPQTSEKSESPPGSDSDSLLNQLFDDEEKIDSAVTGNRPGRAPTETGPPSTGAGSPEDAPPTLLRRTQTPAAPEHRPVHPSFSQLGPLSITLLLAGMMIAIAYLHPPLARIILQMVFCAGALLAIGSYALGATMTPEREPIYTLLGMFFPPIFLLYAINHLDEAGGILVFIGVGIFLMVASTFIAQWLNAGAGGFPF